MWLFEMSCEIKHNWLYYKSDHAWWQHRQVDPPEFNMCPRGEEHRCLTDAEKKVNVLVRPVTVTLTREEEKLQRLNTSEEPKKKKAGYLLTFFIIL